jgi:hypothetical protein
VRSLRIAVEGVNMITIGIDPGASGAVARVIDSRHVYAWTLPVLHRSVDVPALRELLKMIAEHTPGAHLWTERPIGLPGNSPSATSAQGMNAGQCHATAVCLGFDVHWVSPSEWTGRLGIKGKDEDPNCRMRAEWLIHRYPLAKELVTGPRGGILSGPVDALLIAHFGQVTMGTDLFATAVGSRGVDVPMKLSKWARRPMRGAM